MYYLQFLKMFVLLLFTTALGLNLTQFKSFQIEFTTNCSQYLLLQNESNYLTLFQRNNQFELWLTQYQLYECYTAPYTKNFKFDWPEKLINGVKMQLVLNEGSINYPMNFDNENIACPINGISTYPRADLENVFKCPPSKDWIINILIVVLVVLLVTLFGVQHESIKVILGPKISGIVWRVRNFLSRSEEDISPCNSNSNWQVPEVAERLHTP